MLSRLHLCVVAVCVVVASGAVAGGVREGADQLRLPSGREVIGRHVAAIGGAAAYKAVNSVHVRGTLEMPAQQIRGAFEMITSRPNQMLYRVNLPGIGLIENGYDGAVGWSLNPIAGPELLTGRQLGEAAEDAWFDGPLHEPGRVRELTTLERTEFDGQPAFKVRVVLAGGSEQVEYYHVESGLQLGSEASRATPQGIVPITNLLRNYRRFGRLLHATTLVQQALGFEQIVIITSCEYNTVAPSAFELPPAIAGLVRP